MLKIILLFFVFMYSVDFIPTLGGAILPALIIDPHGFFSVYGGGGRGRGGIFHGILLACSLQIWVLCTLYVMISLCMFSYFHPVLGRAVLPVALDGSSQFLPCLWRVMKPGSVVYYFYICVFWCWFYLENW